MPFNDFLTTLARKTEKLLGEEPGYYNSCNANLYTLPGHNLYWHADNEKIFREAEAPSEKRKVLIASISYGATRTFKIHKNLNKEESVDIELKDGDVLTMEGLLQDNFEHTLAPAKTGDNSSSSSSSSTRINLTFRRLQRHHKDCPINS